jgi:protein TonB
VPKEIIYRAPLPDQPPERTTTPSRTAQSPMPTLPERVVPVPTTVPGAILDVTVHVATIPATATEVVLGGSSRPGAADGSPGPAAGSGPDAGGTWDAHAVEVPVRPDPRNPSPSYPEMLRVAGIGGRVLAEFVVDTTGRVRPGSFVVVSATHELFTMSVRRTVASLRFTPALVQGRRVPQRVQLPFEFAVGR